MKLEQSFEVAAPVEQVWQALIDVEKVAPCLPGASVSGRNEDGSYDGTFTVKIGPTSASYAGKLMMEEVDEDTHTAKLQANGTDKRGQGSAKASIVSTVSAAAENRARVEVLTDYHITGRLARFGRGGMIEDISERLLRQFAQRLQEMLEGPGAAVPDGERGGASSGPGEAGAAGAATTAGAAGAATPAAAAGAATPAAEPVSSSDPLADPNASTEQPADEAIREPPAPASEQALVSPQPAPSDSVEGLSLVGSVLWERARRSPAPLAFIAGLLLALILLGRRRH
ncbi:MAG TPA: SRPBCC family protein [Solirubrobacteraceae bacterium]